MYGCWNVAKSRSSPPGVFLGKVVLETRSKFTGEHPCRSVISIKWNEIALRHGCFPVNLLHIFRNLFLRTALDGCFWKRISMWCQYIFLFICNKFVFNKIYLYNIQNISLFNQISFYWGRLNKELRWVESYGLWGNNWRVKVSW